MTRRSVPSVAFVRRPCLAVWAALALLCPVRAVFGWGHEGHVVVALIAEHYMTPAALTRAGDLLDGASIDSVASWADEYRRRDPETGRWHYINIPLADSKIDIARECHSGDCVIGRTEQFLAVLRDPKADRPAKAEAVRYVVHFIGDLHQPLHDEDNDDRGVNGRHLVFEGHPDNRHWVWDTGLLERVNRDAEALDADLESRITLQDRAQWTKGTIHSAPTALGHRPFWSKPLPRTFCC